MSIKVVAFDFEKQSYVPDPTSFSIVSRPVAEHDFIIACYQDVMRSMQMPGVSIEPSKIEAIVQVVDLYTAYREKTLLLPEMKPRDVDIVRRAFSRLLGIHETRLEGEIESLVGLQLGRCLTQISTRQQTNSKIVAAKKLFLEQFTTHLCKLELKNLDEWTITLLQTHPKLVWLKPVVKIAALSIEQLEAIACSLQKQPAQNCDVLLFLSAYEAYRSDFRQAHILFRALRSHKGLPEGLESAPLIEFVKRYRHCAGR